MKSLIDRGALLAVIRDPTTHPALRAVLALRFEQLGGAGAHFHLCETGDGPAEAEEAIGWPVLLDGEPCFEWRQEHADGWHELVFVLSDDGPAQVLLTRDDSPIIDLLREAEAS